jgi:hypothetical protein
VPRGAFGGTGHTRLNAPGESGQCFRCNIKGPTAILWLASLFKLVGRLGLMLLDIFTKHTTL